MRMKKDCLPRMLLLDHVPLSWRRPRSRAYETWKRQVVKDVEQHFMHVPIKRWNKDPFKEMLSCARIRDDWRLLARMVAALTLHSGVR